jgi:hypothetical protein
VIVREEKPALAFRQCADIFSILFPAPLIIAWPLDDVI